ncbi:MAG: ABC-F family ATP-binding cassette domain-containing protein [Minisyncoccales bacterium]|jgi:ATP-binding cassette subfamily F protein 3|nr:ABC-F family ATP-binding cassette domain-containing protein [Candidatus Pacearchaeota archaeon]
MEKIKTKIKISKNLKNPVAVGAGEPLVIVKDVAKGFGKEELFSGARLRVMPRERIAIVGANGMGKTTLLRIIIGQEDPDDGACEINKAARIGYLPQETHWESLQNSVIDEIQSSDPGMREMTARKNDYEKKEAEGPLSEGQIADYCKLLESFKAANGYRWQGLIERLLSDFGFAKESWHRKIASLSGGERTKLALAKVVLANPNLIILDEPTNHLDIETCEWLENFLVHRNIAIVCVSHDRYFLDKVCDKTCELARTGIEKYQCRYSDYVVERQIRRAALEKSYKIQQKYLKEQQAYIDRFRYKATKAAGVQSRIKQLEKIEKIELPKEEAKDIKIKLDAGIRLCRSVLKLDGIAIGPKDKPLFSLDDKLEVEWGDKVGIIGNNGMGKSTLLKTVLEKMPPLKGKITLDDRAQIGYYAQAHEEMDHSKILLDEVASKTDESEERVRSVLGALLFEPFEVEKKKIGDLSGGERARAALAELILRKVNFLLLDEPTNHLDLPSKEVITKVFKEYKGTILLVSHDRYILNEVCNRIWEVKDGKLTGYLGNYDDYRYHLSHSLPH